MRGPPPELEDPPDKNATGGGVSVSVSTDSQGNTHESIQHLTAQQAQQQFLENQQRLQAILAASNPFANLGNFNFGAFNPWLIPPLNFGFPFGFPFGSLPLPAFAYLPAAIAANANNIVATANQAAVNGAQRTKSTVDAVVSHTQKAVKDAIGAAANP